MNATYALCVCIISTAVPLCSREFYRQLCFAAARYGAKVANREDKPKTTPHIHCQYSKQH
jgi:hypothetical protein